MSVYSLARNDVAGAVKEYRELVMGSSTVDQVADGVAMLLQLQDDTAELERQLDAIDSEPTIAAALKRLK